MAARPSAFFHQVSSASRIRVPRAWMAKSTMVVVPPNAAARVPLSKSSAEVVPPNGMSRWVCASIPPGITYSPLASITLSAAFASMPRRTSLIRSPSIRTSALFVSFDVTTLPFRINVRAMRLSLPSGLRVDATGRSLLPAFLRLPRLDFHHRDAAFHGADQRAEVAPHAFLFVHFRNPGPVPVRRGAEIQLRDWRHADARPAASLPGRRGFPLAFVVDALVGAVPACDVAKVAADALGRVDAGDDLVVQVEVLPLRHARQGETAKILQGRVALVVHPVGQAVDHVLHDPVPVVHRS